MEKKWNIQSNILIFVIIPNQDRQSDYQNFFWKEKFQKKFNLEVSVFLTELKCFGLSVQNIYFWARSTLTSAWATTVTHGSGHSRTLMSLFSSSKRNLPECNGARFWWKMGDIMLVWGLVWLSKVNLSLTSLVTCTSVWFLVPLVIFAISPSFWNF